MTAKPTQSIGTSIAFAVGAFACCVAAAVFAPRGFAHRDSAPSPVTPAALRTVTGGHWVTVRGHVDPASFFVHMHLLDPNTIGFRLYETGPGLVLVTNEIRTPELEDKIDGYGEAAEVGHELDHWIGEEHTFTGVIATPKSNDLDDSRSVDIGNTTFRVTGYTSFCESRSCADGAPNVLVVGDQPKTGHAQLLATLVFAGGAFGLGFFALRRRWLFAIGLVVVVPGLVLATVALRGGLRGELTAHLHGAHVTTFDQDRLACDGGNATACASVARHYAWGWDVATDRAKAVEMYSKACDGGADRACADLERLTGKPHEPSPPDEPEVPDLPARD